MLPLKAQGKSLFHTSLLASVTCSYSLAWGLLLFRRSVVADSLWPKGGPFLLLLLFFCLTARARTSSTIWIPLECLYLVLGFRRNIFSVLIIRYDVSYRVFGFFFLIMFISMPLSSTISWSLLRLRSIESVMPSKHVDISSHGIFFVYLHSLPSVSVSVLKFPHFQLSVFFS